MGATAMIPMTKIDGVPDSGSVIAGMAHFSGTGPAGATCGTCKFRGYYRESRKGTWREDLQQVVYRSYRVRKCEMFKKLTGLHGADIATGCASCKYYEKK